MKHGDIYIKTGRTYTRKRQAGGAERKAFCFRLLTACFSTSLALLALAALSTIAAEARQVRIKYYGDILCGESQAAIQFLSPTKGWVGIAGLRIGKVGPDRPSLLATDDGLEHLHPVTSLKMPADYLLDSLFFLSARRGWVVVIGPAGQTRLYRTEDGGESWLELHNNLPAWSGWVQFITPSLGWMSQDHIWRTDDGGKNWRKLSIPGGRYFFLHTHDGGKTWKMQYDAHAKYGTRPTPWGMHFLSATEGWIAGSRQWLLHTSDAGNTWQEVFVKSPQVGSFDSFESVHFFNSRVGVVSGEHNRAELYSEKELRHISPINLYFYKPYLLVTFDGGRTWSYHSLPVPVGRWTQAGRWLLYGINTMNSWPDQTGITEVQIRMPESGKGPSAQGPGPAAQSK